MIPLVYDELRKIAYQKVANEKSNTLGATALVHEAYLRLLDSEDTQPMIWKNRRQFFWAAAEAMRRILIERARARNRLKRGGGLSREDEAITQIPTPTTDDEILAVSDALDRFSEVDPECAELVKLKYFVGITWEEIAELTGESTRTLRRKWSYARSWLFDEIENSKS